METAFLHDPGWLITLVACIAFGIGLGVFIWSGEDKS